MASNTFGEIVTDADYRLRNRFAEYQLEHTPQRFRFAPGADFNAWQRSARAELLRLLKIDQQLAAPRVELAPRTLWKREIPLGTIEKIVVTTEPGMEMPMFLCLPHGKGPFPVFICLQGHSTGMHNSIAVDMLDETTPIEVVGDRDLALQCLKRGYAALCIEQRGMGERSGRFDHQHNDILLARLTLLLGRTLIGDRVFDVDRGIDYLLTRDEIDSTRIMALGHSGGGTTSLYAAATLDRLSGAIISGCFSTFRDSLIAKSHCSCNYLPDIFNFGDMADIAGLCAPKSLVIVNGKDDAIFPLLPAEREFARVREIYRAAQAENNCAHVIGDGGHRFYAEAAFAKFQPTPLPETPAKTATSPAATPGVEVVSYGEIVPIPTGVFAPFIEAQIAQITPQFRFDPAADKNVWQKAARAELIRLLRLDKLLAAPRVELAPRTLWKREIPLGTIEKIVVTAEPGMDMPMYLCLPRGKGPFPVFICLQGHSTGMHNSIAVDFHDEKTPIDPPGDRDLALQCLKRGYAALCIEQRGFGERSGKPDFKHNDLIAARVDWSLGRTLIGDRVFDIDRGIDYLFTRSEIDTRNIMAMGHSGGGTASLYAAATLDRLSGAMASGCFAPFLNSIVRIWHCNCNYIPGILHFGDMGDIAGICAPKKLVIVNGLRDEIFPIAHAAAEFDRVKEIYRAFGKETNCALVIGDEGHRFYAEPAFNAWQKIK